MVLLAHSDEIQIGDYVSWIDNGIRKSIEARKVLRDIGCVHVWTAARVVSFPSRFPVEIKR